MALVTTKALWTWETGGQTGPVVTSYPSGQPTKTGLQPQDLQNFTGVPLVRYGRTPTPVSTEEMLDFLCSAEDWAEQSTGILLTPTMIASPPALSPQQAISAAIAPADPTKGMQLGVDYDLPDAAYDFKFDRAVDDGWLVQSLRYRPLRILDGSANAVKQMAYVYPLLNQFFQIPVGWITEDRDYSLIRIVPQENIQALPLFALQIGLQGFASSVPGGIWMQYTAGLTAQDYISRFRFMKQMVLCQAAIMALGVCQGTVNMGLDSTQVLTDGVQTQYKYRAGGAYSDLINNFTAQRDSLMATALAVVGPVMEVF